MGINPQEFREQIIRPTLGYLNCWSAARENLLLGTALQESRLGTPEPDRSSTRETARFGIYQICPEDHQRVWDHYLAHNPELASRVRGLASQHLFLEDPHRELIGNLPYATAIAWYLYESQQTNLPHNDHIVGLAYCWKRYYPKHPGSGSVGEFVRHLREHTSHDHTARDNNSNDPVLAA